jgi:hypothetical protein
VGLAIIEKLGLSDTVTDNQLEVELHDLSIEGFVFFASIYVCF